MRSYVLGCVALLGLACAGALADEFSWTRQRWTEHTLEFPWVAFREQARRVEERGLTTLEGPHADLPKYLQAAENSSTPLHADVLELTTVQEVANETEAIAALSCQTCQLLSLRLWNDMVAWVDAHGLLPSAHAIESYGTQLCQHQIPVKLLKDWVLLSSRTRRTLPTREQSLEAAETLPTSYLLTQRHGQHAIQSEIQLERTACRQLLEGSSDERGLIQVIQQELGQYFEHILRLAGNQEIAPSEEDDARDTEPVLDEGCIDKHPQCAMWATRGECKANPNYMVGKPGSKEGHCQLSCGQCTESLPPAPSFLEAQALRDHAAAVVVKAARKGASSVVRRGCVSASCCGRLEGREAVRMVDGALAASSREAQGLPSSKSLSSSEFTQTRVIMTRDIKDPLIAEGKGRFAESRHAPPPPTGFAVLSSQAEENTELAAVLWRSVGERCLYVSKGWWLYEVCPGWRVHQFHLSEQRSPDWVISLGWAFADLPTGNTKEGAKHTVAWRQVLLEKDSPPALLPFPSGLSIPALELSMSSGSGCTTDASGKEETAVPRETQLRALCSPDDATRVVVLEPETCRYVVEVYLPELCPMLLPHMPGAQEMVLVSEGSDDAGDGEAAMKHDEL